SSQTSTSQSNRYIAMRLITFLCLGIQAMVLAAPATASKSMMFKEEEWTIHGLSRSCGHRRHQDGRHGHGHDYEHGHSHGKDHEKDRGHGHGKDRGKGYDHGRNGYHDDEGYGYDNDRKSQNGHYGSNKDGYNYDRHKDTGKSSYGHIGNKHNHHDYDRRKDYTGSNGAHGPRATSAIKLGFNKTLDNPPTSVNTAGENGTAMTIANTTTQLSTTTVHGGHDNDDKERCRWSFTVVTQQRGRQRCSFEAGRRASVAEVDCGRHFVVSGGWSGQFGDGQGFTTLSVIDRERRLIVWPAYRDSQLEGGKVVRPDQSYVPQRLP
ncbi:uncharacterized protein PgNI_04467, partial [Pyricularia grisea]|uniref:Uncharacterized protein n=1 Tax=Pyricularia grisea TaxID=148305 RepID=A0A6P8BAG5_PYRGI